MSFIKEIWTKTIETLEEYKRDRKLKALRLQGEISVRQKSIDFENSKDSLERVIITERDSKSEPDYNKIYEAYEKVKVSEKRLELSKEMYKELFGEDPSYV